MSFFPLSLIPHKALYSLFQRALDLQKMYYGEVANIAETTSDCLYKVALSYRQDVDSFFAEVNKEIELVSQNDDSRVFPCSKLTNYFQLPPSRNRDDFRELCEVYNRVSFRSLSYSLNLLCKAGGFTCLHEEDESECLLPTAPNTGLPGEDAQTAIKVRVGALNSNSKSDENLPLICGLVFNCSDVERALLSKVFVPGVSYAEYKEEKLECVFYSRPFFSPKTDGGKKSRTMPQAKRKIAREEIEPKFSPHFSVEVPAECYLLSYTEDKEKRTRLSGNLVYELPNSLIICFDVPTDHNGKRNAKNTSILKKITKDIRYYEDNYSKMQEIVLEKIKIAREYHPGTCEAEGILSRMIDEYRRMCLKNGELAPISILDKFCNNDFIWVMFFAFMYYYSKASDVGKNSAASAQAKDDCLPIEAKEWCVKMLEFLQDRNKLYGRRVSNNKDILLEKIIGGKTEHVQANTARILAAGIEVLGHCTQNKESPEKRLDKLTRVILGYINTCEHQCYYGSTHWAGLKQCAGLPYPADDEQTLENSLYNHYVGRVDEIFPYAEFEDLLLNRNFTSLLQRKKEEWLRETIRDKLEEKLQYLHYYEFGSAELDLLREYIKMQEEKNAASQRKCDGIARKKGKNPKDGECPECYSERTLPLIPQLRAHIPIQKLILCVQKDFFMRKRESKSKKED